MPSPGSSPGQALVTGIHAPEEWMRSDVDCRDKPSHDGETQPGTSWSLECGEPHVLDEILQIEIAHVGNAGAQPVEMRGDRGFAAGRIARLDRLDDGRVLLEHPRHAS